jgi:hypothetical protein
MGFEKIPTPDSAGNEGEPIRFKEGGREFSMTPEEQEAHEEAVRRGRIMEEKQGTPEIKESKDPKHELTKEEQEILEEIVPDAKTRAKLDPEVVRMLVDAKKEELEEGKREAA